MTANKKAALVAGVITVGIFATAVSGAISFFWWPRQCNGRVVSPIYKSDTVTVFQEINDLPFYGHSTEKAYWPHPEGYFDKTLYVTKTTTTGWLAIAFQESPKKVYISPKGDVRACRWSIEKNK